MSPSETKNQKDLALAADNNAINKEVVWGHNYRCLKSNDPERLLEPTPSPVDISYFAYIRRSVSFSVDKPKKKRKEKSYWSSKKKKKNLKEQCENTLLARTILNPKEYIDCLCRPKRRRKKKSKKIKPAHIPAECPPRITQLAAPKKRLAFDTWRIHGGHLSAETICRLQDILQADESITIPQARKFFKRRDKIKRKLKLKLIARRKDKTNSKCLKKEVKALANAIMSSLLIEPNKNLNYRELLISEKLLLYLSQGLNRRNPIKRYSKNCCNRALVEVTDKVATLIDRLTKVVDVEPVDEGDESTKEGSILAEEEGEGYDFWGEDENMYNDAAKRLNEDSSLQELIRILANASDEYLSKPVNTSEYGEVSRNIILNMIKIINKGDRTLMISSVLEDALLEWAKHNQNGTLDNKVVDKIHDVSEIVAGILANEDAQGMMETDMDNIANKIRKYKPKREPGDDDADQEGDTPEAEGDKVEETEKEIKTENEADEAKGEEGNENPDGTEPTNQEEPEVKREDDGELVEEKVALENVYLSKEKNGNETEVSPNEDNVAKEKLDVKGGSLKMENEEGNANEDKVAAEILDVEEGSPKMENEEGNANGDKVAAENLDVEEGSPKMENEEGNANEDKGAAENLDVEEGSPKLENEEIEIKTEKPEEENMEEEQEKKPEQQENEEVGIKEEATENVLEEKDADKEGGENEVPGSIGPKETPEITKKPDAVHKEGTAAGDKGTSDEDKPEYLSSEESKTSIITVIKGHTPSSTIEHSPDTVCCLSLKIWAVWLLEITHNAHNWTQWISNVIARIREFTMIIKGKGSDNKAFYKEDWIKFLEDLDNNIVAWRQYSKHVEDLTNKIIDKFHDKKVGCCPKCMQDNLIKNVSTAHVTMKHLTEALNCAGYWQRCLNDIVETTSKLNNLQEQPKYVWVTESQASKTGWSYESLDVHRYKPIYSQRIHNSPCTCQLTEIYPPKGVKRQEKFEEYHKKPCVLRRKISYAKKDNQKSTKRCKY